mmetsp:Transcript_54533/g.147091  ORF Transcript_54533/g.147091 Transcript_54533/m.147091 type:complete len:377 (+) Transcript_54533:1674-2804(+)
MANQHPWQGPLGWVQSGKGWALPERDGVGFRLHAVRRWAPEVRRGPVRTDGVDRGHGEPAAEVYLPVGRAKGHRDGHDHGRHRAHQERPRHEAEAAPRLRSRAGGVGGGGEEDRGAAAAPGLREEGRRHGGPAAGARGPGHPHGQGAAAPVPESGAGSHGGAQQPGRYRRCVLGVPGGDPRVLEDILLGLAAAARSRAARRVGHIQLVPLYRRAGRWPRSGWNDHGGLGGVGPDAAADLPAEGDRRQHGLGADRFRAPVPADSPSVPGYGRRHGHGSRQGEVRELLRARGLLLPRRGDRRPHDAAHPRLRCQPELERRPQGRNHRCRPVPRPGPAAHQHPSGHRRGRADQRSDLCALGGPENVRYRRGRYLPGERG